MYIRRKGGFEGLGFRFGESMFIKTSCQRTSSRSYRWPVGCETRKFEHKALKSCPARLHDNVSGSPEN